MRNLVKTISYLAVSISLGLISANALGHGEDKPGPHNGFIQMPGAFHTEVVPYQNGYKIYLLDIEFKNPTTKNSSLSAILQRDGKDLELKCQSDVDHFFCPVPNLKSSTGPKETLVVTAKRDGMQGNAVNYQLPLHSPRH